MATIADLLVKISGDSSGLQRELAASQRQIRRTFGGEALSFSSGALAGLTAATLAMGALGLQAIKMAGDFTASSKAFETLLGSAEQAKVFLEDLQQFAAQTPFELNGLMDTSKKLLAFKFAAEDVIPIMNTIGNAAAMLGSGQEGINGMTMAISQMQAKGRVQGEELLQLAERGVNAYQYLAKELGTTIPGVMDMVSKGMVDSQTGINAILKGMQADFKGGMLAQSKEIPGIWSNIKDSTEQIFINWGKSLTNSLNLKEVLGKASNSLTQFAQSVKTVGLNESLRNFIPPSAKLGISMFAGALVGVGCAAMYMFGTAVWTAMAPLLPFIAIGMAVGALAYLIWDNWKPLSAFFSGLWESIGAHFENWTLKISAMMQTFTIFCFERLQSLMKLMGSDFSSALQNRLGNMKANLESLTNAIAKSDARTEAASKNMRSAWDAASSAVEASTKKTVDELDTTFNGLKKTGDGAQEAGGNISDAAGKGANSLDSLANKVQQVSDAINRDWVSATKNQQEQLEIWYAEQLTKLDEVKDGYADYEQDKLKLAETYTAKREKLMREEADKAISEFERMKSSLGTLSQDIVIGGLRGSEKDKQSSEYDYSNKVDGMKKVFSDINQSFENADAESKKRILSNLDQFGVEYKNIDGKRLDFSKSIADAESAYLAQKNLTDLENHRQCKDIKADIDQAYAMNSLAMLQESLSAEDAERLNNYEAQKSMMDTYQEVFLAAHATTAQLMADMYKAGFSGISSSLSDIFTGTKSVGEAFNALGKTMLKVVADFVAKWIAGRIMMAIMGKTTMDAEAKASIAAATAQLAVWSKLASAVSLATFGANAAPAAAGMTMVYGLGAALTTVPALAHGGITQGNTIANIGEGHYEEAVMPLSKKYFEKVGLVNDGQQVTQNIYGDINSGADYEDMWDDLNDMFAGALRGV